MTLISFNDLCDFTGYKRPGDVVRWAKKCGVPVFPGKDGPCTTSDALNVALGISYNPGAGYGVTIAPGDRIEF